MTLAERGHMTHNPVGTVAIDGVPASRVCHPAEPQELADLLREASADDHSVYPVGSGLHQRFGRPPERVDIAISTAELAGIVRYDPEDLVVSVRAGTTLEDLQAELAIHGQWLPVEAPGGSRATIGGMLALGLIGPRQLSSLSLRDLLLGMSVALTDGTVAKSGGMVVKNVSGFDMGRLHVGANGTLGIITSANFKVLPRPETEATVIATFSPDAAGVHLAFEGFGQLRASVMRAVAADILVEPDAVRLSVRFEGRAAAVQRQAAAVAAMIGGEVERLDDPAESRTWWERHVERLGFASGERTMLRLDTRPREMEDAVTAVMGALATALGSDWRLVGSPGLGQARIDIGPATGQDLPTVIAGLGDLAGSMTLLGAPPDRKAGLLPVRSAERRSIDGSLRDQFDPRRILNRGRFPMPSA